MQPWAIANPYGILVDDQQGAWHAGRDGVWIIPSARRKDTRPNTRRAKENHVVPLSRQAIALLNELEPSEPIALAFLTETDPGLLDDLNALVEPDARGDPMSPLRWTCKSLRRLAAELDKLGHKISHTVVGELLKTREGADNPDRDAQFHVINDAVETAMTENQPAISVDTKKKELVGDFKNAGRGWRKKGDPEEVRVHDFLIKELGRAVPYGIYDLAANAGRVNVGVDNDTAAFAVQAIRRWWQDVGRVRYPLARRLVVTADGGGSNGSRVRLLKLELLRLAMNSAYPSRFIICRRGPANGTKSSIARL